MNNSTSIRKKILLWIIITITAVVLGIGGYSSYRAINVSQEKVENDIFVKSEQAKDDILIFMNYVITTSENLAQSAKHEREFNSDREKLLSIASDFLNKHNKVFGISIGWEKNDYDDSDSDYIGDQRFDSSGRFVSYLFRGENENKVTELKDPDENSFYNLPKEKLQTVVTEPYNFLVAGNYIEMITISVPIIDNGNFLGIVGLDITKQLLSDIIKDLEMEYEEGYLALYSSNGVILGESERNSELRDDDLSIYRDEIAQNQRLVDIRNDNYKFVLPFSLYDQVDEKMTLIYTIPRSVVFQSIYPLIFNIGFISLILVIMAVFLIWKGTIKITGPIIETADLLEDFNINNLPTITEKYTNTGIKENDKLAKSLKNIIEYIRKYKKEEDKSKWLENGKLKIHQILNKKTNLNLLIEETLTCIAKNINVQIGAFYIKENNNQEYFILKSSYAYPEYGSIVEKFREGKGLIGQAVLEKKILIINDVPENYVKIESSLGNIKPNSIVIVPCIYQENVTAVIELGFMGEIKDIELEYLSQINNIIAVSLDSNISKRQTERLLKRTKKQADILKKKTKILEEQKNELEKSEAELKQQEEELRVSNEELEEQTELLEEAKEETQKINQELLEREKNIKEQNRKIKEANKYKTEFLANMSHELRTPLNSIMILSDLLKENNNNNLSESEVEYAKNINSSGSELLNLINDILNISKIEAGKSEVNTEKFNISTLAEDLEKSFKLIAKDSNNEFEIFLDSSLAETIKTDYSKIRLVIKNLLSNAFKFTKNGKIKLNFKNPDNNYKLLIEVIDNGIGVSSEKQDSIFEAFKQEDGSISRNFGGTGLGLALVKSNVEILGGKVELKSKAGEGSNFRVYIDDYLNDGLKKEESDMVNSSDKNGKYVVEKSKNRRNKIEKNYIEDDRDDIENNDNIIIIIEDDLKYAKAVMALVKDKGFKVIITTNGIEGLYYSDLYIPDAIILDIKLPDIDGWEVKERLNKNPKTKDIPVYFSSAYEIEESKQLLGAVEFINKPLSNKEVGNIIEKTSKDIKNKIQKVLIIEDNKNERESMVSYLKEKNKEISIDSVSTGSKGLKMLKEGNYDCLILDLNLKEYKALSIFKKIKSDLKIIDIPIIVYTGRDISREEEKIIKKNAAEIIIKGEKSQERLLDELNLFLHDIKKRRSRGFYDKIGEEIFVDKNILIVDDDMKNVFALSNILDEKGVNIIVADNGKEALQKLETNKKIDLILMDIMMPVMDGYEAISRIRKIEKYNSLPIIALTAKAMKEDRNKAIQLGANDYLTKPLEIKKLLSVLRVWLYE